MASRSLSNIYRNSLLFSSSSSSSFSRSHHHHHHHLLFSSQTRSIFITSPLEGWMDKIKGTISDQKDKIKGVLTGQKISTDPQVSSQNFTLPRFADELKTARKLGSFKKFIVGRSSEATFADAFEKQESIIRFLGLFDPTGDNLQSKHKQDAAKHCNCTITEVENALAKFTWAKEAQKKMEKLKEEGKPIPTNLAEVQKLMGSTPVDLARSNLAKSGQISRNALCPCGSKKRYKRCCGETDKQKA